MYIYLTENPYHLHQSEADIAEEQQIIERAKQRPEAFGLIYEKYYSPIYYFVHKRIGDETISADVVSQVFLKALDKLSSYKFKGLPFSAWLYRIATNQVNEFFRRNTRQRVVSLEPEHVSNLLEEWESHGVDPASVLGKLFDELNDDEVQLLELRFFEERPFQEVAYILDISETNAKVKVHRVLKKLKKVASEVLNDC